MCITKRSCKWFVGVALVATVVFSSVVYAYNTNRDNRLVLPDGYAWINGDSPNEGLIYRADGTIMNINSRGNVWVSANNTSTWYTNADNDVIVIVDANGIDEAMSYTVTKTTLTLDGDWVFTKRAVTIQ